MRPYISYQRVCCCFSVIPATNGSGLSEPSGSQLVSAQPPYDTMRWLRTIIVASFISTTTLCGSVLVGSPLRAAPPGNGSPGPVRWTSLSVGATKDHDYRKIAVQGRVAFLGDVLQRRFGVQTVREARDRVLVLETTDGKLMPIVEDPPRTFFPQGSSTA